MNILVTGGAGFIGSHLVKALVQNQYNVFVIDNLVTGKKEYLPENITFIEKDINDANAFEGLEKIDAIIHLAAQVDARASVGNPVFDAESNVLGTIACLEFARKNGVKKFIFSSTCGVYGDQKGLPIKEIASTEPLSAYGVSKLCSEKYIEYYERMYNLDTAILRFANVYGPRQYRGENSGVISLFAHLASEGEPLRIFGDGKQTRDYIYVEDIVSSILASLSTRVNGPLNIGTGVQVNLIEVVELIKKQLKRDVQHHFEEEKAGDIKHSCLAINTAKSQLNWEPQLNLEEGIKRLFS